MDQSLFHLINQRWMSAPLDLLMAGLSDSQIWRPFFIAAGFGGLLFGGFTARIFVIWLLISLAIAGLVPSGVKSAVARHRPKQMQTVRMVQLQRARAKSSTWCNKPTIRGSDCTDRGRSGPSCRSG